MVMDPIVVGVLALQGDFAKHAKMLESLGAKVKEIRKPQDLQECQGLIIPGGESTAMLRQMDFIGLRQVVQIFAGEKPVFGTCAGLILMSKNVQDSSMQTLGLLDVTVERNAFGRQADSFQCPLELDLGPHPKCYRGLFIRAPRIQLYGPGVRALAFHAGEPVLIQQGRLLGATFHPELTGDPSIHAYFLELIRF
jgi:pyridoxal 5'-phosphate synthase pdxT subunit